MEKNKEYKSLAINALLKFKGPMLELASVAFRNCTENEMQEIILENGKTRAQILADHKERMEKIDKTILWIESL